VRGREDDARVYRQQKEDDRASELPRSFAPGAGKKRPVRTGPTSAACAMAMRFFQLRFEGFSRSVARLSKEGTADAMDAFA
jgi:hypothetical protein